MGRAVTTLIFFKKGLINGRRAYVVIPSYHSPPLIRSCMPLHQRLQPGGGRGIQQFLHQGGSGGVQGDGVRVRHQQRRPRVAAGRCGQQRRRRPHIARKQIQQNVFKKSFIVKGMQIRISGAFNVWSNSKSIVDYRNVVIHLQQGLEIHGLKLHGP